MAEGSIQLLSDSVIDQIAAGEVVERPASIVKELVENALDAKSTYVSVELVDGGKTLIRVADNGHGIAKGDLPLSIRRHATSKLTTASELVGIRSHGFRGEALASIASVADLSITTRTTGDDEATKMRIEGGQPHFEPVAAPVGTVVEVANLFESTPVRKKFLKSQGTEVSHISAALTRLSLGHPHVHLKVISQGRVLLETPRHESSSDRVRSALKAKEEATMVRGEESGVSVLAHLYPPGAATGNSSSIHLLINGRGIRDRNLTHSVRLAYGDTLPKGRYPLAVVYIDMPGDEVDINVHPQKTEVRFVDPQRVAAAVRRTIRRGIVKAEWHASHGTSTYVNAVTRSSVVAAQQRLQKASPERAPLQSTQHAQSTSRTLASAYSTPSFQRKSLWEPRPPSTSSLAQSTVAWEQQKDSTKSLPAPQRLPRPSRGLRYIGIANSQLLVCESASELVLLSIAKVRRLVCLAQVESATPQKLLIPEKCRSPLPKETFAKFGIVVDDDFIVATPPGLSISEELANVQSLEKLERCVLMQLAQSGVVSDSEAKDLVGHVNSLADTSDVMVSWPYDQIAF